MILVIGIPGAGKTTFSRRFANVVHRDDCPHPQHETFPRIVAASGGDVVAEGVVNSRKMRKLLLDALPTEWEKTCIWLDTPLDACIGRETSGRNRPLDLRGHASRFEPPTLDEGWDEIVRISGYERRDTQE